MNEMNQGQILLPVLALAGLTFVVLLQIPYRRFKAGLNGLVTSDDFKLGESKRVPDYVVLANRNYMNLLELPVLFYVACILFYILEAVEIQVLALAWGYVLLRFLHSGIHLCYNKVLHRLIAFASSNLVLAIMWIYLLMPIFFAANINA